MDEKIFVMSVLYFTSFIISAAILIQLYIYKNGLSKTFNNLVTKIIIYLLWLIIMTIIFVQLFMPPFSSLMYLLFSNNLATISGFVVIAMFPFIIFYEKNAKFFAIKDHSQLDLKQKQYFVVLVVCTILLLVAQAHVATATNGLIDTDKFLRAPSI